MLETLVEQQVIFYAMGIVAVLGILGKIVSQITLRRMVRAAEKMNKSNHKLMKLVKAKFEHASMISDKVRNVGAFVKKYVYEYRVFGVRLHTWQQMEMKSIVVMAALGVLGALSAYVVYGMGETAFQYGAWGGVGAVLLFLVHISSDEAYLLKVSENYMVEFLENVFAHRYENVFQPKEIQQEDEMEEEEVPIMEAEIKEEEKEEFDEELFEEKVPQEVRIRKILEEFLA